MIPNLPRWAWGAILTGLGVIALFVALHIHDRNVVKADRAKQEAQVTRKELESEREANRKGEIRDTEREEKTRELREAADNAPNGNDAGPKTRAVLDELRRQAAANQPTQ